MKSLIAILLGLLLTVSVKAQSPDRHLFVKDHLNITLTNTWSRSTEYNGQGNGASLGLAPDLGGKLGFIYTINLGRRFGIETGTYFGVQSIGYQVKVDNDPDYPLNNFRHRDAHAYVEIPFRAFGRFRLTEKIYSYSYLGAHVTRFRDYRGGVIVSDEQNRTALEFNYETNFDFGMYLFWNLGTGFLLELGSGDMLRLNVAWHPVADRSLLMHGDYIYRDPSTGVGFKAGNWKWGGGYVGLELGYVFTRSRELARQLEKK